MHYLLGFLAGVILSGVTAWAFDDYQQLQQSQALQRLQQIEQQRWSREQQQFFQDQADRMSGKHPC